MIEEKKLKENCGIPLFLGRNTKCAIFQDFKIKISEGKFVRTQFPVVACSMNFKNVYFGAVASEKNVEKLANSVLPEIEKVKYKDFLDKNILKESENPVFVYAIIKTREDAEEVYNTFLKFLDIGFLLVNCDFLDENKGEAEKYEFQKCIYSHEQATAVLQEGALESNDIDELSFMCLMSLVYNLKTTVLPKFDFSRRKDIFIFYNTFARKKNMSNLEQNVIVINDDNGFREKVKKLI